MIILMLSTLPFLAGAQNFIDNVFSKYSGKDNFTSIVISKDLLDLVFSVDSNKEVDKIKGKIADLKILVSDNEKNGGVVGFTNEVRESINKENYLSLMEVLNGKEKVNFYVKKDNDRIVHLLLIATGKDEEVLLSLRGNFSMKDLSELGKGCHDGTLHHLSNLKNLEK